MPMIWLTKDIKIWQISSTWINGLMPTSVFSCSKMRKRIDYLVVED